MEELNQLKHDIRIIDPNITDELLDLLYEYITKRFNLEVFNFYRFKK